MRGGHTQLWGPVLEEGPRRGRIIIDDLQLQSLDPFQERRLKGSAPPSLHVPLLLREGGGGPAGPLPRDTPWHGPQEQVWPELLYWEAHG